jgi:glycosyltransferase involved in cell wall biosynthesis
MRVCLITTFPPSRHHLSEYGFHLADELRRQNIDFTILGDEYAPEQSDHSELPGFMVRRCWRVDAVGNALRILTAVREIKPDIVWFNLVYSTFGTNPIAAFAGLCIPELVRAAGFKTHVTLHHLMDLCDLRHADISFPRVYRVAGSFATRMLLCANSVSVLLERYQRILQQEYGARNIAVRPHGTLGTPYPPDLASRPANEFRMLAFGKWGRYKRLETPLDALSAVLSEVPNASLLIAGCDHPNRPGYLAALKEKWGNHPQINFLGYLDEDQLDEVFRTAHVAVMPYLSSGGPSGVAHIAARFGLPIVSAEVDDFVRLAEEEGLAIDTYKPGDSADLATRLIALAHDPARQARVAEQNYQVAVQSTMPRIVASYIAEFERLLDESKQLPTVQKSETTAAYGIPIMALPERVRERKTG